MVRKHFLGDALLPKAADSKGEVIFEKDYENENEVTKEVMNAFSVQGHNPGDEINFELDGVRKIGVISNIFYAKPNNNSPGSTDYCMIINVKDPDVTSGQILQVECSLDDVVADVYKVEKIGDNNLN
jgi:hypothetical protein